MFSITLPEEYRVNDKYEVKEGLKQVLNGGYASEVCMTCGSVVTDEDIVKGLQSPPYYPELIRECLYCFRRKPVHARNEEES